jgi:hypothetical protein
MHSDLGGNQAFKGNAGTAKKDGVDIEYSLAIHWIHTHYNYRLYSV